MKYSPSKDDILIVNLWIFAPIGWDLGLWRRQVEDDPIEIWPPAHILGQPGIMLLVMIVIILMMSPWHKWRDWREGWRERWCQRLWWWLRLWCWQSCWCHIYTCGWLRLWWQWQWCHLDTSEETKGKGGENEEEREASENQGGKAGAVGVI